VTFSFTLFGPAQADHYNHVVRAINVSTGTVRTLAGQKGVTVPLSDGVGSTATFDRPTGIALDSSGATAVVVS
jgi:hypothetical protein